MTAEDLVLLHAQVALERDHLLDRLKEVAAAATDAPSDDEASDIMMEALFLRTFTRYEETLEQLFLHYVTGGSSLSGIPGTTFLAITDEGRARKLVRAGFNYLSWSKPEDARTMANNYLDRGWPFVDMLAGPSHTLNDCAKLRNRIAHRTDEARSQFAAVQRNLFQTERLFDISPGQLLRCRYRSTRKLVFQHYGEAIASTLQAIVDPPV